MTVRSNFYEGIMATRATKNATDNAVQATMSLSGISWAGEKVHQGGGRKCKAHSKDRQHLISIFAASRALSILLKVI
eukprot:COSAG01_NODE_65347_length_273_cov_1.264368_1_plen_76_part_01